MQIYMIYSYKICNNIKTTYYLGKIKTKTEFVFFCKCIKRVCDVMVGVWVMGLVFYCTKVNI